LFFTCFYNSLFFRFDCFCIVFRFFFPVFRLLFLIFPFGKPFCLLFLPLRKAGYTTCTLPFGFPLSPSFVENSVEKVNNWPFCSVFLLWKASSPPSFQQHVENLFLNGALKNDCQEGISLFFDGKNWRVFPLFASGPGLPFEGSADIIFFKKKGENGFLC